MSELSPDDTPAHPTHARWRTSPRFPLVSVAPSGAYRRFAFEGDDDLVDFYHSDSNTYFATDRYSRARLGRPLADMTRTAPVLRAPAHELWRAYRVRFRGVPLSDNPFLRVPSDKMVSVRLATAIASAFPELVPPIGGIPIDEQNADYKVGAESGWDPHPSNLYWRASRAAYARNGIPVPKRAAHTRAPKTPSLLEVGWACFCSARGFHDCWGSYRHPLHIPDPRKGRLGRILQANGALIEYFARDLDRARALVRELAEIQAAEEAHQERERVRKDQADPTLIDESEL